MNRPKDSAAFEKELFDFLRSQGHTNIKIPMIGQKALNLFLLYNEVISRGGAEAVSNNKQWKDIVNKFDLPATCTSASFTLKNHYQKYLLAYEQKFFFNKSDAEMIKKLENIRQKRIKTDSGPGIYMKTMEGAGGGWAAERAGPSLSLEQLLKEAYEDRNPNEQVYYLKRKRLVPFSTEIKRIILAFESKIASEVRFALNALLFYSCSKQTPFYLENYRIIFNELLNYFEYIVGKVEGSPCLAPDQTALGLDNGNTEVDGTGGISPSVPKEPQNGAGLFATAIHSVPDRNSEDGVDRSEQPSHLRPAEPSRKPKTQRVEHDQINSTDQPEATNAPLFRMSADRKLCDLILYVDKLPLSEHIEQLRIVLTIFRNLIFIKVNELFMSKYPKLVKLFYRCFLDNNDAEINRLCLEIFSVLSRYVILNEKPHAYEPRYFEKIAQTIHSETDFDLGVENLHNLMINQENENQIEGSLGRLLPALVKFLTCNSMEVVERVLEIFCHFSDLKISTRVLFARQPHFFQRLVAIIAGNSAKSQDKLTRVAALIISNILVTPVTRPFFKPLERELFAIASVDEKM